MATSTHINFSARDEANRVGKSVKYDFSSEVTIDNFVWKISDVEYRYEKNPKNPTTKSVLTIEGIPNCFVRTDENVINGIDKELFRSFLHTPLKIGDEIKFHCNAQGELKVIKLTLIQRSDIRYIATKIYKNNSGNYLIWFDEISDHATVQRMRVASGNQSTQIQIITDC
jgi:hypothetical protein